MSIKVELNSKDFEHLIVQDPPISFYFDRCKERPELAIGCFLSVALSRIPDEKAEFKKFVRDTMHTVSDFVDKTLKI